MEQTEYQKFYLQCKLDCPCGGVYSRYNLSKHKKTKKTFILDKQCSRRRIDPRTIQRATAVIKS